MPAYDKFLLRLWIAFSVDSSYWEVVEIGKMFGYIYKTLINPLSMSLAKLWLDVKKYHNKQYSHY